jgi:hypothetical protein
MLIDRFYLNMKTWLEFCSTILRVTKLAIYMNKMSKNLLFRRISKQSGQSPIQSVKKMTVGDSDE